MTARQDFQANPILTFLQRYATGTVKSFDTNTVPFAHGRSFHAGAIHFRHDAPVVHATFQEWAARNTNLFAFSRPVAEITLHQTPREHSIPVYYIPYLPNTTSGVRLPSAADDGRPVAYALTDTMTGCTLSVSGDPRSPLAAHSNVMTTPDFSKATMLSVRLGMLERVARTHYQALPHPPDLTTNQSRLEVFNERVDVAVAHTDYFRTTVAPASARLARLRASPTGLVGAVTQRSVGWTSSYTQWEYRPAPGQVTALYDPNSMIPLTMIGERRGGQWRFYHQQSTQLGFQAAQVTRAYWDNRELARTVDPTIRRCDVILNRGEFWPVQTNYPEQF